MKKIIAVVLTVATMAGLFSACGSTRRRESLEDKESGTTAMESPTEAQTPAKQATCSGVTAPDVYWWTKKACMDVEFDPDLSPMVTEGQTESFTFFMDTITVVCECENGYVTQIISASADDLALDLAFSSAEHLAAFLYTLAFPVYNLGDFDDPTELVSALVNAEAVTMDGVDHRPCVVNDWLITLSTSEFDNMIAIIATYMGEDDDVNIGTCEQCGEAAPDVTFNIAASICDDCLDYNQDDQYSGTSDTDYYDETSCDHVYTEATCLEPKTCMLCGETKGGTTGHDYMPATCTEPKTCWDCGETVGSTVGHDYMPATCTEPKTCWNCGETKGSALGHDYLPATCETPKICTVCWESWGYALGHDYTSPTCTDSGYCKTCGDPGAMSTGHDWMRITETVYHEEQGHYEEVEVAVKGNEYQCWLCSYAQPTYKTLDAYYTHFDSVHGADPNNSYFRERYDIVERWSYEYETQWIVDVPAYTETITTGYRCRVCGEEE